MAMLKSPRLRRLMLSGCAALVLSCGTATGVFAQEAAKISFAIQAQDLATALRNFALQSKREIFFAPNLAAGKRSTGVYGELSPLAALDALLANTGLRYRVTASNTILIEKIGATAAAGGDPPKESAIPGDRESAQAGSQSEDAETKVEKVTVTGSRVRTGNTTHDVKVFDRKRIDQSGQTSVPDFLNTLPSASVSFTEQPFQSGNGGTSVSLRGLPVGTTLVLINGRRVQTSGTGAASDFFDLNSIPLAAVERIEVLADGSSAIYGSDAIAGVVNIIMKRNFDGVEASSRYGWANGIDESNTSVVLGREWERGSALIVTNFQSRGDLISTERALTASNDYTAFGGPNNNFPTCSPGNVFSVDGSPLPGTPAGNAGQFAAVSGSATSGTPTFSDFNYDVLNECSLVAGISLIPATHRTGIYAQGTYQLLPTTELFVEVLFSHVEQLQKLNHQNLFGVVGFQSFTASADNPFNPFGTTVGVAASFDGIQITQDFDTQFVRPVIGARGEMFADWQWEVSALQSADWTSNITRNVIADAAGIQNALNSPDPAIALNPFVAGAPASQSVLQSYFSDQTIKVAGRKFVANAFARGPLLQLPAGAVETVVGGEYDSDSLATNVSGSASKFRRESYALFGEAKVPILGGDDASSSAMAVTLAGRYDHYADFGDVTTPQVGIEWRPFSALLFRATYAEAFKAPSLTQLHFSQSTTPGLITDPTTGDSLLVPSIQGGNPDLSPMTGQSHTFGLVYAPESVPGLRVYVTSWNVKEDDAIQVVPAQFIVDNEATFPGRVTRDSSGQITLVDATFVNFGSIEVAGLDYQVNYLRSTALGEFSTTIGVTNSYLYESVLAPGAPPVNGLSRAQDSGAWAPRWKGTVALNWDLEPYAVGLIGRYVGPYRDYNSTRAIDDFWLFDASARYDFGTNLSDGDGPVEGAYIQIGVVNAFDQGPEFSNYSGGFLGYDPAQADIRGRLIYIQVGTKF